MGERRIKPLVVAGLGGDSGKSLVTIGLIGAMRRLGLAVAPFKKGPDFIDAAWLGRAAGRAGRNLDTYLMSPDGILDSVSRGMSRSDVAVVEGNRGLFDGMTAKGDHSTAVLARLLHAPVLLVVDVTKVTRTVAAIVKGCALLEPDLRLGGVILNRVGTLRQERVIREAVETETGIPVMGAVYRNTKTLLPSRHLGLLTATEHPDVDSALATATDMVERGVDIAAVLALAGEVRPTTAPAADFRKSDGMDGADTLAKSACKIAVFSDSAFSFYYPENLEALERLGASLVYLSPLADTGLPDDIDGVYAGGGFPEVYAERLAGNAGFRLELKRRIDVGLPVFAECGGLMYLSRTLMVGEKTFPMVGALPVDVAQRKRPKGHGYVSLRIDGETPFFAPGAAVRGHEFHYSEIISDTGGLTTAAALEKGVGIGGGRDGIVVKNVTAFYTHFHAHGAREWAARFIAAISKENRS